MTALYNEIDPKAAAVLNQLIADDVIAPGVVDTRPIEEIQPEELSNYTQVHFFAGGGLWSVAARLAGWPDNKPLWTGSCPCQPFSVAGQGLGTDDPRHLWPHFYRLIRARRPPIVVGEQVAGKAGYGWLDGVRSDLEHEDYACRGVDVPACAVDAPHQRQRLYWLAVAHSEGERRRGDIPQRCTEGRDVDRRSHARTLVDANGQRCEELSGAFAVQSQQSGVQCSDGRNGSWYADAEWLLCPDGKTRRAKPGIPMLVDGLPGRVALWSIAGNAIVPVLAAEVLKAYLETEHSAKTSH